MSVLLYHLHGGRCEPGKDEEGKVGQGWTSLFSSTHPISDRSSAQHQGYEMRLS